MAESPSKKARTEHFPGISKIKFVGPKSKDPLSYKYYNADEVVMGKPMKEWCRFAVCWWHTFNGQMGRDPFSMDKTHVRPWDKDDSLETFIERVHVAFEFFTKLGVEYYCFHDTDIAPQGKSLEEFQKNLDVITDLMLQKQKETGIKLLWCTQNCFSHTRYKDGAATNPDVDVFSYACAQTKKMLETSKKLGGVCHVFWGGREGFMSPLNTNVRKELDHMASFFKMAIKYKEKIGHTCQFLIEPKAREPCTHQYDYDAQTVIGFLRTYDLHNHFKVNIEPNHTTLAGHDYEHDILMSSKFGMLGSIDSNTGDPLLGWDTDQFPMDVKKAALVMKVVLEQGGLAPGGLNFDCKVRRESTDVSDMFIAHIGAMDTFARGLKSAAAIIEDDVLPGMVRNRYSSFESLLGQRVTAGLASLEECAQFAVDRGEPLKKSGQQELFEMILNRYV